MSEALVKRLRAVLDPLSTADDPAAGHAAVMMALTDEAEPKLWLIRRSLHMMLHPGQMAFPGGKGEREDIDLLTTALREAEEEVALPRASLICCGALSVRRTLTGYSVSPFVGVVPADLCLYPSPGEVAEVIAVPLRTFADHRHLFVDQIARAGIKRDVPRYEIGGATIWGMTAALIVELVNRLYDAGFDPALHAPPPFPPVQAL